jgi:imidazolonepropionase-like amidohydrolase
MSRLFAFAASLLLVVAAPRQPTPAQPKARAYLGATVFDGTGRDAVRNAVVVVRGERVLALGPRATVQIPDGAERIDVAGKWIVPGLIDAHVHFFQSGGLYTRPDVIDLTARRSYAAEQAGIQRRLLSTFRRYLASGVTSVVDPGGPFWLAEVRDRAHSERLAPRVAIAGPLISTRPASPLRDLGDPPIIEVTTPEAARDLVRRELARNPDLIKVLYGVTPDLPAERSRPIVRAAVEEAHAGGKRVAIHATELEAARIALEAGADILVHSVDDKHVDAEFLALAKRRNVLYIPTLIVLPDYVAVLGEHVKLLEIERRLGDPDAIASWADMAKARASLGPEELREREERTRRRVKIQAANLRAVRDTGITIAAGDDAGNIGTLHGPSFHRELLAMVDAGLTPREVLVAATRGAAHVFAARPSFGTLERGKLADFLVLDGDPLADIANLQQLRIVVKGGDALDPGQLAPRD